MLPATWLQVHNIIALRVRTGGNNVDPEINGVSRHPDAGFQRWPHIYEVCGGQGEGGKRLECVGGNESAYIDRKLVVR